MNAAEHHMQMNSKKMADLKLKTKLWNFQKEAEKSNLCYFVLNEVCLGQKNHEPYKKKR